jgi:hypothetical protein
MQLLDLKIVDCYYRLSDARFNIKLMNDFSVQPSCVVTSPTLEDDLCQHQQRL